MSICNSFLGNRVLRMRTCVLWKKSEFNLFSYILIDFNGFIFLEQGNSSSPEADLRSLNHPPRGLPAHLGGYPIYPVTGKHNPSGVRERTCVLKCF